VGKWGKNAKSAIFIFSALISICISEMAVKRPNYTPEMRLKTLDLKQLGYPECCNGSAGLMITLHIVNRGY